MSKPGFTPGPWSFDATPNLHIPGAHWREVTADAGHLILCEVFHDLAEDESFIPDEVAEANAHLIAAAPDLYAALEHMLGGALSLPRFAEVEARAALAKARGEEIASILVGEG